MQTIQRLRPELSTDLSDRVSLTVGVELAFSQGRSFQNEWRETLRASALGPVLEAAQCTWPEEENSFLRVSTEDYYLSVERLYLDWYLPEMAGPATPLYSPGGRRRRSNCLSFKLDTARHHSLLGSLDHENEHIREAAARNLGALKRGGGIGDGDVKKAVRALEPLAGGDSSPHVREAAARSLSQLDGRPAPTAALPPPSPPPPLPAPVHRPRSVAWGGFVDPLGQCDIIELDDRIEIRVPAGAYDLSIELGQTTAPRLMQPIEGDFMAEVTVDALPDPGPPTAGQPRRGYHGAGLLLWLDERSYVRLESAAYRAGESIVRHALFEARRDGWPVAGLARPEVRLEDGPTSLRLERRGGELRALARQDHGAWREVGGTQIDLPPGVQVGIAVVNTATSALRGAFRGFELVREPQAAQLPGLPSEAVKAPEKEEPGAPSLDYDAARRRSASPDPSIPRRRSSRRSRAP